jgi:hypothetical protein
MFDWIRDLFTGNLPHPTIDTTISSEGYPILSYHTPVHSYVSSSQPHQYIRFSISSDLIFIRHRDLCISVTVESYNEYNDSDLLHSIAIVHEILWPPRIHKIWKSTAYCMCHQDTQKCTHSYPYCYKHDGTICDSCMIEKYAEHEEDGMGGSSYQSRDLLYSNGSIYGGKNISYNLGSGVVDGLTSMDQQNGSIYNATQQQQQQQQLDRSHATYSIRLCYTDKRVKIGDYLLTVSGLPDIKHKVKFTVQMYEYEGRKSIKGQKLYGDRQIDGAITANEDVNDDNANDDVVQQEEDVGEDDADQNEEGEGYGDGEE